MKCLNCKNEILYKRSISNFFRIYKKTLCDKCYKDLDIKLEYNVFLYNDYKVVILYSSLNYINANLLMYDNSLYIKDMIKKSYKFFYFDNVSLDSTMEKFFEIITKLECSDIYLITSFVRN